MNKQSVLVVAAHPDDEVLGCGGVMQKHVANGDDVYLCVVTEGSSIQYPGDNGKAKEKADNCHAAAKLLGVKEVFWLDFANMKLGTMSHVDLNRQLETVFGKVLPSIVYTPSTVDVNRDHVEVCKAIEVVCRPNQAHLKNLKKILAYEILSSTEWSRSAVFQPNVFIDITNELEKKVQAMAIYALEVRPYPHSRSLEGIRILAQYRGLQAGMKAAEAFRLLSAFE